MHRLPRSMPCMRLLNEMEQPSVASFELPYPADCVEASPGVVGLLDSEKPLPSNGCIAVGLYNHYTMATADGSLVAERNGGLALYKAYRLSISAESPPNDNDAPVVQPIDRYLKPNEILIRQEALFYSNYGVLDLRWLSSCCPVDSNAARLVSVCSDGAIRYMQLEDPTACSDTHVTVQSTWSRPDPKDSRSIGVALDIWKEDAERVAFCCSDGMVYVIEDGHLMVCKWKAHDIEMWCIAFDPKEQGNLLATGADDACLKLWDTRTDLSKPIAVNRKEHTMGVTAVSYSPKASHEMYTGSYDETVRLWDKRQLQHPVHTFKASGGVWRLKCCDSFLLAACCHGGVEVWEDSTDHYSSSNLRCYHKEHMSMVYGVSMLPLDPLSFCNTLSNCSQSAQFSVGSESKIGVSCSFYDKRLNFWELNLNNRYSLTILIEAHPSSV